MKNKQALVILFIANAISGIAQGISMLAIQWDFTRRNMGQDFLIYSLLITFLSLFWMLYAGILVDGFNRKDVFLGNNFIQGLIILSISSLGYKEGLPSGLIALVFGLTLFSYYIHFPNLYAFAQEISDPKDYGKVITLIEVIGQSTQIAAASTAVFLLDGFSSVKTFPFFGEVLIEIRKWEIHEIFLVNAFTYFLAFGLIIFIRHTPVIQHAHEEEGNLLERLKAGTDYLRKNALITVFGVCSFAIFVITLMENYGIRSIYVKHHLQESGAVLSVSEFMFAMGSLMAGVGIRKVLSNFTIPQAIIILTMVTTFGLFVVSMSNFTLIFYIFSFIVGFTSAGSRIFRVTYLFKLIPNEIAGRVNSVFNVWNTILRLIFFGIFIIPFFSEGSNIVFAYAILGVFTLVCSLILLYNYKKLVALTSNVKQAEPVH